MKIVSRLVIVTVIFVVGGCGGGGGGAATSQSLTTTPVSTTPVSPTPVSPTPVSPTPVSTTSVGSSASSTIDLVKPRVEVTPISVLPSGSGAPAPAIDPLLIMPTQRTAGSSNGVLGEALATIIAGTYNLKCYTPPARTNPTITNITFTVSKDGTTRLNDQPWIDYTHPGDIALGFTKKPITAANTVYSAYPSQIAFSVENTVGVLFNLNIDGLLLSAVIQPRPTDTNPFVQYMCPTVLGDATFGLPQNVPLTLKNITSATFNNTIGTKIKRNQFLNNCSSGGSSSFAVGSDASVSLGALASYTSDQVTLVKDGTFGGLPENPDKISKVVWGPGGLLAPLNGLDALDFSFDSNYLFKKLTAYGTNKTLLESCK